jgi:hypothetical protein
MQPNGAPQKAAARGYRPTLIKVRLSYLFQCGEIFTKVQQCSLACVRLGHAVKGPAAEPVAHHASQAYPSRQGRVGVGGPSSSEPHPPTTD